MVFEFRPLTHIIQAVTTLSIICIGLLLWQNPLIAQTNSEGNDLKEKIEVNEVASVEEEMWQLVRDTQEPEVLEFFLKSFPNSKRKPIAVLKLNRLKKKEKPSPKEEVKEIENTEKAPEVDRIWGIGFDINFNSSGTTETVFFPINITPKIVIEPEIRAFSRRTTIGDKATSSDSDDETKSKSTEYRDFSSMGVGFLYRADDIKKYSAYYGLRLGIVSDVFLVKEVTSLNDVETETIKSDINLSGIFYGPVLGSEYFIYNKLSIGGEVQYIISDLTGTEKLSEEDEVGTESKIKIDVHVETTETRAFLTVRWYF